MYHTDFVLYWQLYFYFCIALYFLSSQLIQTFGCNVTINVHLDNISVISLSEWWHSGSTFRNTSPPQRADGGLSIKPCAFFSLRANADAIRSTCHKVSSPCRQRHHAMYTFLLVSAHLRVTHAIQTADWEISSFCEIFIPVRRSFIQRLLNFGGYCAR